MLPDFSHPDVHSRSTTAFIFLPLDKLLQLTFYSLLLLTATGFFVLLFGDVGQDCIPDCSSTNASDVSCLNFSTDVSTTDSSATYQSIMAFVNNHCASEYSLSTASVLIVIFYMISASVIYAYVTGGSKKFQKDFDELDYDYAEDLVFVVKNMENVQIDEDVDPKVRNLALQIWRRSEVHIPTMIAVYAGLVWTIFLPIAVAIVLMINTSNRKTLVLSDQEILDGTSCNVEISQENFIYHEFTFICNFRNASTIMLLSRIQLGIFISLAVHILATIPLIIPFCGQYRDYSNARNKRNYRAVKEVVWLFVRRFGFYPQSQEEDEGGSIVYIQGSQGLTVSALALGRDDASEMNNVD